MISETKVQRFLEEPFWFRIRARFDLLGTRFDCFEKARLKVDIFAFGLQIFFFHNTFFWTLKDMLCKNRAMIKGPRKSRLYVLESSMS